MSNLTLNTLAPSSAQHSVAVASLLTGATIWGLIWYPYRFLAEHGLSGTLASACTYGIALCLGLVWYLTLRVRSVQAIRRADAAANPERVVGWGLLALALAIGVTNVTFVWATIHGVVMRVVLLFYLCPVWTALFAWLLLGERLKPQGALVILLGLGGAVVMLWHPEQGWPFPQTWAEWAGLLAGFLFALSNVLLRKVDQYSRELKTVWVLIGCTGVGLVGAYLENQGAQIWFPAVLPLTAWILLPLLGGILLLANWIVQYGIERLPANRVAVIYLFELIVAGGSGWWLAGESFGWQEAAGAALIACASVLAAQIAMAAPTLPQEQHET